MTVKQLRNNLSGGVELNFSEPIVFGGGAKELFRMMFIEKNVYAQARLDLYRRHRQNAKGYYPLKTVELDFTTYKQYDQTVILMGDSRKDTGLHKLIGQRKI